MKERPILIAVIGYIIGIVWGLYFQFSIVLYHILILVMYYIGKRIYTLYKRPKFKLISFRRYSRYLRVIMDKKSIFIIIVFSILANSIVLYQNKIYPKLYKDGENIQVKGIVVSQKIKKEYYDLYQVKILNSKNFNLFIQVDKKSKELAYGDEIKIRGIYEKPEKQKNYGGYSEEQYLKTIKVAGKVKITQIQIIRKNQGNKILQIANHVNLKIKERIEKTFDTKKSSILKGLLLGETTDLQEEVKEKFQIANISHILAISGMHINYIIIGMQWIGERTFGKRKTRIVISIILIFYVFIAGFSPSIVRAVIMSIITIGSGIVYRKSDVWNAIAISLLVILIYNPFLIVSIGLQLSYLGTIGIILFKPTILKVFRTIQGNAKGKQMNQIKEIIVVSLSSQIMILPILIYHFNSIGIYFLFTNLLVSLVIGPIIIIGFFSVFFSFIVNPLPPIIMIPLKIGINFLDFISKFSQLPFSKIYVPTPNIICMVLYFLGIFVGKYFYSIYHSEILTITQKRVKNLVALFFYKVKLGKKKCMIKVISIVMILIGIYALPKGLKIHFVDVGQGDCTFIVTPQNKTILLDAGGNLSNYFDVGKKIVVPYLLDRGYHQLDYVMVSHFDQDHVRFDSIFITRNKSKKCDNRKAI